MIMNEEIDDNNMMRMRFRVFKLSYYTRKRQSPKPKISRLEKRKSTIQNFPDWAKRAGRSKMSDPLMPCAPFLVSPLHFSCLDLLVHDFP